MDSLESLGYSALGSRSKRLSDYCFEQLRQVYDALSISFDPTFYPYIAHVAKSSGDTIADLAKGLGISHPAASKMAKRLVEEKLIALKADKTDKRTKHLFLSEKGASELRAIQPVLTAINSVMETIDAKSGGLLASMETFEQAFAEIPLRRRVLQKLVEELPLSCRHYSADFHAFYETHNRIWIQKNFTLEETDLAQLGDPETHILAKGGRIYVYCLGDYPVGGFSLLDDGAGVMQFSKMYVPEGLHGLGIGNRLLPDAIEEARRVGCKSLYLLSNTLQAPAIHLYRKLGFVEVPMTAEGQAQFKRANIRMEMLLAA